MPHSAMPTGKTVTTGPVGVTRFEEFGHIRIGLTLEEFGALGFAFGDSVDAAFSNGKRLEDIPCYSGYYTAPGNPQVCGYPGYTHPVIARNYGAPAWDEFGLAEGDTVTVTLREKGKYLQIQQLFSLKYSNARKDFPSDAVFSNFRELRGGDMKAGRVFRSASPCDNQYLRAACTDRLIKAHGIRFALNLSDSEQRYAEHAAAPDFSSPYYDALYRDGKVMLLPVNADYRSGAFAKALAEGLRAMAEHEGPCLIHCTEGKDRTGFACAPVLALAGAQPEEILDDYMVTFGNYYGITRESDPERYEAIRQGATDFLRCLCGAEKDSVPETRDLRAGAEACLRRGGLDDESIARIRARLTE